MKMPVFVVQNPHKWAEWFGLAHSWLYATVSASWKSPRKELRATEHGDEFWEYSNPLPFQDCRLFWGWRRDTSLSPQVPHSCQGCLRISTHTITSGDGSGHPSYFSFCLLPIPWNSPVKCWWRVHRTARSLRALWVAGWWCFNWSQVCWYKARFNRHAILKSGGQGKNFEFQCFLGVYVSFLF